MSKRKRSDQDVEEEFERPSKLAIITAPNITPRKSISKAIKAINRSFSTDAILDTFLFTPTFPCQVKSFIWNLSFCGGASRISPLAISWWLHRVEQGAPPEYNTSDGADLYRPSKNLIACGSHLLKPGIHEDITVQDPDNPWVFDVEEESEDPARTVTSTINGTLTGTAAGVIDLLQDGTLGPGTITTTGTHTLRIGARLTTSRVSWDVVTDMGRSDTFKQLMTGDRLVISFRNGSLTGGTDTFVFGSVQFFIES